MSSDTYAASVLKEAADKDLSSKQLISVLHAAGNIKSDHYLSTVLIDLSDQVRSSDASVKDAYRATAKKIRSETYYGRAIRAID